MKPALAVKDRGWKRLHDLAKALQGGKRVKVGVLDDGSAPEGGDLTVGQYAAVNEFGTEDGRVPERSFVRSTFDEQREELKKMASVLIFDVVLGSRGVDESLGLLGAKLAAEIKKKITDGTGVPPPNAPSTALAKARTGRTKSLFEKKQSPNAGRSLGTALAQAGALASVRTLVDTGRMLGAVGWAIISGGGEE